MAKLKIFGTSYPFGDDDNINGYCYVATSSMIKAQILLGNANGPGMDGVVISQVRERELSTQMYGDLITNPDKVFNQKGLEATGEKFLEARNKLKKAMEERKSARGKRHAEIKKIAQYQSSSNTHFVKKGAKTTEEQDLVVKLVLEDLRAAGFEDIAFAARVGEKKPRKLSKTKNPQSHKDLNRAYLQGVGWALGVLGSYNGMGEPDTAKMILSEGNYTRADLVEAGVPENDINKIFSGEEDGNET
ncbi:hypothetical protein [Bdellovibrio sp. BCCA]|uniref:hypothetical protein n=1 Tax=Bdellovibrio sp. BCCA TaxID=3136281 RepID=UPI0030F0CCD5